MFIFIKNVFQNYRLHNKISKRITFIHNKLAEQVQPTKGRVEHRTGPSIKIQGKATFSLKERPGSAICFCIPATIARLLL